MSEEENKDSIKEIDEEFVQKYLSKFSYMDWEDGEEMNSKETFDMNDEEYEEFTHMKLGDFVLITFEEPSTGDQTYHYARIVIDEDYGIPCFAANEELNELGNSGQLWGIYDTAINGAMFMKVSEKSWFENLRNL